MFSKPDRKKQGRELDTKARTKVGWINQGGLRRPKVPKKHTPGKDHRKFLILLLLGLPYYDKYFEDFISEYF